jgi:peptidoglycan-associated lipoprotein
MSPKTKALIIGVSLIAVAGCAKRRAEDLPEAPMGSQGTTGGPNDGNAAPGSQADFVARVISDRVYFDTDRYDVDAEDQRILGSQAEWLKRYPDKRVTIEGHCDERGTRDYNIALGARRANSAKNYLASLGVDARRISTVSYGKERPEAVGSDEGSWARNRRAVTITVQ